MLTTHFVHESYLVIVANIQVYEAIPAMAATELEHSCFTRICTRETVRLPEQLRPQTLPKPVLSSKISAGMNDPFKTQLVLDLLHFCTLFNTELSSNTFPSMSFSEAL